MWPDATRGFGEQVGQRVVTAVRPLQGARDEALSDIFDQGLLNRYVPIFALQIIWRLARPDLKNLVDRFQEHRVPVRFEVTEDFGVRQ